MITYKQRLTDLQNIQYYKELYTIPVVENVIDFINRFCFTFNPRAKEKILPFELYPKQIEFINFLWYLYQNNESGAVDKCRDVGATWCVMAFFTYLLLFQKNNSLGCYSYKAEECHKLGDISTSMGKVEFLLTHLPNDFHQNVVVNRMHIRNPETGSDIVGSSGDNPARGNRRTMYFKDECAFYQHAEMIEAALSEVSDVQLDVSTHKGTDTLFYTKVSSGAAPVFVFDWWDNPTHTQEWYNKKKAKAEAEGLLANFHREIDRDPSASIESVLIPSLWVKSALKTNEEITGKIIAGLDIADEGADTNALVINKGNILLYLEEWSECDTGETADRAFWKCVDYGVEELRFDNIGVGAGAKARFKKIQTEIREKIAQEEDASERKRLQKALDMKIIGWSASASVVRPIDSDYQDRPNKELFENAKSQAYFRVREELLQTYRSTAEKDFDETKIITFTKVEKHPLFQKFCRELSQPQQKLSSSGKIMIDKKAGKKSPNLAEAYVISRAEVTAGWIPWSKI